MKMASISVFKNAVTKFYPIAPSLPSRPKFSRVCFTSSTRFPQVSRNAAEDDGRRYDADDTARDEVKETMDKGKQKTQEMKDKAAEKAKQGRHETAAKAHEMNEKSKEKLGSMRDKTMDTAGKVADKTKEQAHEAKEKTKGVAAKVADTAHSVGEKAKETVQGAWGAAKETTHKIKETVVGKSEDVDSYVEDHVRKPSSENEVNVMDDNVRSEEHNR